MTIKKSEGDPPVDPATPAVRHIERAWDNYAHVFVPPIANKMQRAMTKEAYFAGAYVMWNTLTSLVLGNDEPTQADHDKLHQLAGEMNGFRDHVSKTMKQSLN